MLRQAEALHRELERALEDLGDQFVEGSDATGQVHLSLTGKGEPREVRLEILPLDEADRRRLEEAVRQALKMTLERLFEMRRKRAAEVTRGMTVPGLFL